MSGRENKVTGPNPERKDTWCLSCLGPTNNENRCCDVCSDFLRALDALLTMPQGRRVLLSPLRRDNLDVFDLREDAQVQCPISCGGCCDIWGQVKELAQDNVLEAARGAFTGRSACPHMTEDGCELPLDKKPLSCSTFLCSLALWVHGGKVDVEDAKRIVAASGEDGARASQYYKEANGDIEKAVALAEEHAALMRTKVG